MGRLAVAKRYPYNFGKPDDYERFRQDMRTALHRVNINAPYGRPLVPIPELDQWRGRALVRYKLLPEGGA